MKVYVVKAPQGEYESYQEPIVKVFADEIVRCLRSNYDYLSYQKSLRIARTKYNMRNKKKRD